MRQPNAYFYPRSPCGERPHRICQAESQSPFLSTLSLRRATRTNKLAFNLISPFLSTLSLRRATCSGRLNLSGIRIFLSTLSLRRATRPYYPQSRPLLFLSTLSLRRATTVTARIIDPTYDFYPRSPCGERQQVTFWQDINDRISIHALLAESDRYRSMSSWNTSDFYPRSPCGERRACLPACFVGAPISIHALLAESDYLHYKILSTRLNFYPRSPCGERLGNPCIKP